MKKIISLIIAFAMLCSTAAFAHPFKDAQSHWADAELEKAYNNKVISGDPDGKFRPDDAITRAEFLKMLAAEIGARAEVEIPEADGEDKHWAAKYYSFATTYMYAPMSEAVGNITPGIMTAETYDLPIPRWEMAFMLSETMRNVTGMTASSIEISYVDKGEISKTYPEKINQSVASCFGLSLMTGDENNKFNPSASGTRAEAVTVINRVDAMLEKIIESIKAAEEEQMKQYEAYEQALKDNLVTYDKIPTGHPIVYMVMENGKKVTIELYPEYAPQTVANFVKLVKEGFYNGLTFHRIVPGFVAQGGDPDGDGSGGSDANIKGEFLANGVETNTLSHTKGVISMARSQHPDSATSQFFICLDDAATALDGSYAAFGKVIAGMDVVEKFAEVELEMSASGEQSIPKTPIIIKAMTVK
ncbi:MAG: peptidylprolyl isomerase [Clostridia bacterium]|nr:peptidylprolyl isomerase [Clostridia bacterium]